MLWGLEVEGVTSYARAGLSCEMKWGYLHSLPLHWVMWWSSSTSLKVALRNICFQPFRPQRDHKSVGSLFQEICLLNLRELIGLGFWWRNREEMRNRQAWSWDYRREVKACLVPRIRLGFQRIELDLVGLLCDTWCTHEGTILTLTIWEAPDLFE